MTHMALWLSQAQFFMSVSFMLLFLLLEIGLAWALAYFKLRGLRGDGRWTQAYRFWVRIFALAFVLSFAAAVPVMIQFGSLWPLLLERTGNVAGPILAATVLTLFLFKSCFVGAMLFAQRYVSPRAHAALVVMVAVGVTMASLCPVVLFSWMRTPTGAFFSNGQYFVTSWSEVIFNPALGWYVGLLLTLAAATSSLSMLGVSAMQSLRRSMQDSDALVFNGATRAAALSLALLTLVAVQAGLALAPHEPARAAAAAGYWHSGPEPSFTLATLSDTPEQAGDGAWRWLGRGGAFLARDAAQHYRGLDQFSGMAPPMQLTFWSLRVAFIVTLLGLLFAGTTWVKLRAAGNDPVLLPKWLLRSLVAAAVGGGVIALSGFAHVYVGAFPYAVAGTVTLSEVGSQTPVSALLAGGLALAAVYACCITGFVRLLRHSVQYGVVPVARRRGRA